MSTDSVVSLHNIIASRGTSTASKRKRDDEDEELQRVPAKDINIRFVDGETKVKRQKILAPICLLHRARLPLAWLDPQGNGVQQAFADVPLLKREDGEPTVLIAQEKGSRRYHAIESAGRRAYAVCRLAAGIEQKTLERRAMCAYKPEEECSVNTDQCREVPVIAVASVEASAITNAEQCDSQQAARHDTFSLDQTVEESCGLSQRLDQKHDEQETVPQPESLLQGHAQDLVIAQQAHSEAFEDTAFIVEDALKDLTKHYLSDLYLSRTSLAYFVKGPLTRARNAFEAASATSNQIAALVAYLREMVLSTSANDRRAKDISDIIHAASKSQAGEDSVKKRRTSKTWKPKRDRHDMLPDEKQHIESWWQQAENDDTSSISSEPLETILKQRLSSLRNREIFLQTIIIMEILSIEEHHGMDEGLLVEAEKSKQRSKKKMSLRDLLDVLLDKLTISYSVDALSPQRKQSSDQQDTKNETNDHLKSFCIEIIIPFYAVKLPKIAAAVNKKLGGPSAPTPVKRSSASRRPGEPTERKPLVEKKPRKQLHRIATDTNVLGKKPVPSLHRSATDSQVFDDHIFKRERSQSVSLHSIPPARQRAGSSLFMREIDFTARNAAYDDRMKKKAEQEAKVRAAIAGIRKPDRSNALKETAARVDAAFAEKVVKNKKATAGSQTVVPSTAPQNMGAVTKASIAKTITATPKKQQNVAIGVPSDAIPTSVGKVVDPNSGSTAVPATGLRERTFALTSGTPSREVLQNPFDMAALTMLAESPAVHRVKTVECTPMRPRMLFKLPETPPARIAMGKHLAVPAQLPLCETSPNILRNQPPESKSLYDALGWNNDDDYEPLA